MSDRLKPGTETWHRRQAVHRHNGFRGSATMIVQQTRAIMDSRTATSESKELANKICNLAHALDSSLKKRQWP